MSSAQGREARKRTSTAATIAPTPLSQQKKRPKATGNDATTELVDESALPGDYKHRIGSAFIEFPTWQTGKGSKQLQLSKAQKRVVQLIKDLCKRKGGQFFSRPVDPIDQGLEDYFEIVTDPLDLGSVVKGVEMGFYCSGAGGLKWHERIARDVEQVWANALLYNPPGNIVSEAAMELKESFSQQLAKVVEDAQDGETEEGEELLQLVMDDYAFRDTEGRLIGLDSLLERGCAGVELSGLLVRNRRTQPDRTELARPARVQPTCVRFEHVDTMDGMTGAWVVVWVRTSLSWIRLLDPHVCWQTSARASLEKLRLSGLVTKSFVESSKDAPERVVRSAMKAVMPKTTSKTEEDRIHVQLLEAAEYTALCVDRAQAAEEGKIAVKDSKKLNRKLLHDAEKERAKKLFADFGSYLSATEDKKTALEICGAVAGLGSRIALDSLRDADAEGLGGASGPSGAVSVGSEKKVPGSEKKKPSSAAEKAQADAATPATSKAPKEKKDVAVVKKEGAVVKKEAAVVYDANSGYWERDAQGVRRWVSNAPQAAAEPEVAETVAKPSGRKTYSKRSEDILAESPLTYAVGARVGVLFDDQQWYVGKITSYNEETRLFHVEFSENDVDDISMPDPDVKLVCPVDLLQQAVDEAADASRKALKALLQHEIGKDLAMIADDLRKKMTSQHRSYKDVLQRTVTGKVPEGNWSVEGVKATFMGRIKAKFVEVGVEAKQWDFLTEAADAFQKETKPEEEAMEDVKPKKAPAAPDSKLKTPASKRKPKADAGGGEAMEVEEVKKSPPSEKAAGEGEAAPSTSKKGKRKHADEGAETPAAKVMKSSARTPVPSAKAEEEQDEAELDKCRSDWAKAPEWLKKNAMVEVEYDGDWWQAKAVKCVSGKIRCNYVGSDDFEWIRIKEGRLRPPSEDWDKVIGGQVGEVVEVKRKVGVRNKWMVATVIELVDKKVRVQYIDDGVEDWVTLDAKTIRPMADSEPAENEHSPPVKEHKERRSIVVKPPTRSPFPEGKNLLSKWDGESIGAGVSVKHFLSAFGKAPFLHPAGVDKAAAPLPLLKMMETMDEKLTVSEWVVAFFVRALAVLIKQESSTSSGPAVLPDALNWTAWLLRMLERDVLERGRRMIKDRLEESYLSEEALADHRISKAALMSKGRPIQFPDPSRPYEEMHGEEVQIQGGPMVGRQVIKGQIAADAESGVHIAVAGVEMTVSDFLKFHGIRQPLEKAPVVTVVKAECSLAQWEASLKQERAQDEDGGGAGQSLFFAENAGNHHRAFEAVLGTEVFKAEKELADALSTRDWEDLATRMRWRSASWVCDAVAETEVFRAELLEHSGDGDKAQSTTTGWALFLAKKGGMKNAKEASEQWKNDDATRAEYNEKARVMREQEQQQKSAKEAKRDLAPVSTRQEPLGSDLSAKRYWWASWAGLEDAKVAVEKPANQTQAAANPYPTAGSSRALPFEADPEWTFFDTVEELDMLEKYLDAEDEVEGRLLKHVRNERAAAEAAKACLAAEASEHATANDAHPALAPSSAPPTTTPAPISVLPTAPLGLSGMLPQPPGTATPGGTAATTDGQPVPGARKIPPNVLEKFPHRGEYFAVEDETPISISEMFGVDTEALVEINKSLYAGLHARARFKAGTLLILPAPTVESLGRSPLRPREHVLSDTIALLLLAMQVVPLSLSLSSAVKRLAECVRKADAEVSAAVEALIDLEHAMLLPPLERTAEPRVEEMLLPAEWLTGHRAAWMVELEKAKTWAQVGLLIQEFHLLAITKITRLRQLCTTRWSFRIECHKAIRPGAPPPPATDSNQQGLVLIPMKGEIVVYLRRGHKLHLDHYCPRPWDAVPGVPVASCIVEDTWFFKGSSDHVPFCALQLRPIFQGQALVGKQILVGELPATTQPRRLPAVCIVTECRSTTQMWLPSAPGMPAMSGGPGQAPQAPQKIMEYLLRFDTEEPDCWVCLERAKYQLVRPDEAGPPFFVTVHYEQVLPEFLVTIKTFRESERVWAKGTGVRMWWRDEEAGGGEYYTGEVLEQKESDDPWDSVHVRWDRDGDDDWVCPWELQVWSGPRVKMAAGGVPAADEELGEQGEHASGVITTVQQAEALKDTGIHSVENDDETANQIAQRLGVDAELLVQMNRGSLSGLTKHAKLHKKTKLRIPPKGLRFERHTTHSAQNRPLTVVSAQRLFPKEDEVWWDGAWSEDKTQACQAVLRKVMRHRHSSAFLEPVDYKELGLDDYPEVVKKPMDLGTISKKLDGGQYNLPAGFRADVHLVFENAKLYNPQGQPEHQNAVLMLDLFEESWREEKERLDSGGSGRRRL